MDRLAAFMWLVVAGCFRNSDYGLYLHGLLDEQRYLFAYLADMAKLE